MNKYIFPVVVLLMVIGVVTTITRLTQQPLPEPPMLDGWDFVTRDKYNNFYYASLPTITFDGGSDVDFRFHARFRKTYSEGGREELTALFTGRPSDVINSVAYELETIRFHEKLDGKYIEGADRQFYRADDSEIAELKMNVTVEEDKPLPRSSVGENLYDFAYNRLPKR